MKKAALHQPRKGRKKEALNLTNALRLDSPVWEFRDQQNSSEHSESPESGSIDPPGMIAGSHLALPPWQRWTVKRLLAWLQVFRRLATRYEYPIENFLGMVRLGHMKIMLRYF